MGTPSDRRRRARRQRPGKRERARVKTRRRLKQYVTALRLWDVVGAGTVSLKYGRKKARRVACWLRRVLDPS